MMTLWQDVRYGLRRLAPAPGFAALVVLILAIVIGAAHEIVRVWPRHPPVKIAACQAEVAPSRVSTVYPETYIAENTGQVLVEIPEVFELANIAIAVSELGRTDPYKVNKRGDYYRRVLEHFLPFKDHPLLAQPALHQTYGYPFRDNSVCYAFEGDKIVPAGPYARIRNPDLFQPQLARAEDFARVSHFRQFYRDNLPFYRQQVELYRQRVPVREMWTWLEERFPARHNCYKVIFSPLLGASHETRSFRQGAFSEIVMFVNGPGGPTDPWNRIREGHLSRSVFTEIDHNYVNPITAQHEEQVRAALGDLRRWNCDSMYASPEMTFNEYATWAVFILYACDTYGPADFETIREQVIRQMVEGRKFLRFREFAEELLRLYRNRSAQQAIPDLYPPLLSWVEKQSPADRSTAGGPAHGARTIVGQIERFQAGLSEELLIRGFPFIAASPTGYSRVCRAVRIDPMVALRCE